MSSLWRGSLLIAPQNPLWGGHGESGLNPLAGESFMESWFSINLQGATRGWGWMAKEKEKGAEKEKGSKKEWMGKG